MANNKKMEKSEASALFTIAAPKSPVTEQFKTVRTNIKFAQTDKPIKSVVITSSGPSEGKSTLSSNLAVAFAQSGMKTLLVDADMRRPVVHSTFDLENTRGLSTLLSVRRLSLQDVTQDTEIPNLSVMTSGPKAPNPSELLSSQRMRRVIELLEQQYDFIIFDMPPLINVTDAQIISNQVDGVILSVKEGVTEKPLLTKAVNLLRQVDANVLGTVYIGSAPEAGYGYYYS
ncbi:CpsD/CapB family tyrosine-protein kinase [Vagococcus silagei]|uniref:Tyrosine-protein kinase CpsD n=1 Tax=Vagococcus silagei TaxID=2508885 RepID=A0A4S3B1P9_9ENTE|nr:CpsD/CapB family tyrosine-protein kinase [Vagococcus silagei]THB60167.1 polysaccharide biosynthesis tyrosine autokinase [Vagococcus silagei]